MWYKRLSKVSHWSRAKGANLSNLEGVVDNDVRDAPHSFTTPDGMIRFNFDMKTFDIHLDAHPQYDSNVLEQVLRRCDRWGLELIPPEEAEPELLFCGWTRMYLTPVVPEEVVHAEAVVATLNLNVRALRQRHRTG